MCKAIDSEKRAEVKLDKMAEVAAKRFHKFGPDDARFAKLRAFLARYTGDDNAIAQCDDEVAAFVRFDTKCYGGCDECGEAMDYAEATETDDGQWLCEKCFDPDAYYEGVREDYAYESRLD